MDTFMDKLAQKLNAQEIIRANSAADAEEMGKLKNQINEYNECLERLQKLLDDGMQKFESVKVDDGEINRLVEESIAKINEVQRDNQSIEEMKTVLEEQKVAVASAFEEQKVSIASALEEMKGAIDSTLGELKLSVDSALKEEKASIASVFEEEKSALASVLEEQKSGLSSVLEEQNSNLSAVLEEQKAGLVAKIDDCNENVHKECVKVYRNVQAVVLEENGRQTSDIIHSMRKLRKKLNVILGITISALVVALGGVVFQLLTYFKVF